MFVDSFGVMMSWSIIAIVHSDTFFYVCSATLARGPARARVLVPGTAANAVAMAARRARVRLVNVLPV